MTKPVPLVLQIQADASDPSVSVSVLLRRAKIASSKLGIKIAEDWIDHEINGYKEAKDLPDYRILRGSPKFLNPYNGWRPLIAHEDEMSALISVAYIMHPATVLENLVETINGSHLHVPHANFINEIVCNQLGFGTKSGIDLAKPHVWGIVERVKNSVLDWSLDLEREGIIGEGMSFTVNERRKAASVTYNYFAHNMGVAGDVNGGSVQNNQFAAANLDLEGVRSLLQQLQQVAPMLPPEVRPKVEAEAAELQAEVAKPQPNQGRVRQLLGSIRTVCEGAGGSIIAAGVVEGIKLLGG